MSNCIEVLNFLNKYHGKNYRNPENCEGDEKTNNDIIKKLGETAGREFKSLSNSCCAEYNLTTKGNIHWQENNGKQKPNKVKEYLWVQMKYEQAQEYAFGIAIFAEMHSNKARFRVSFEIKTNKKGKEDLKLYHTHLDIPKKNNMVYLLCYDNNNNLSEHNDVNTLKEILQNNTHARVQISIYIDNNGNNEQIEQEIINAVGELIPYYKHVLGEDNKMENELVKKYSNYLVNSKNIIFHGAPGTGKTYLAKQLASYIVSNQRENEYEKLSDDEKNRIGFVQFHPSYDYTDFVEGLRPKLINGTMGFELKEGIFMEFVNKAIKNYEDSQKSKDNIINEQDAESLIEKFLNQIKLKETQFTTINNNKFTIAKVDNDYIHINIPNNKTSNELSLNKNEIKSMLMDINGFTKIKDVTSFFKKRYGTQAHSYYFVLYNEIIKLKPSTTNKNQDARKNYVFIIDEINRGEISKIFGELFYSIDPGYRGKVGEISTQYSNLHEDPNDKFYIPDNVYIIGTMNDIDRSVDSFDFAMRRRFRFVELKADEMIGMLDSLSAEKKQDAMNRMKSLNKAIEEDADLNESYKIGAAYFLKLQSIEPNQLWSDYLEPLLRDYIQGMHGEKEIIAKLKNVYDGKN